MKYNPAIHHRRSIRLKGYDYSKEGAYFITITCDKLTSRFGKVVLDHETRIPVMELNELGSIAYEEWLSLEEQFENCWLNVFQIMPNHMHGIVILNEIETVEDLVHVSNGNSNLKSNGVHSYAKIEIPDHLIPATTSRHGTIGEMVGTFKSRVANRCLEIYKSRNEKMGKLWQRDYWDNIIRDENAFDNISRYIINNPAKWMEDKFFVK